jgi:hypothetical protein
MPFAYILIFKPKVALLSSSLQRFYLLQSNKSYYHALPRQTTAQKGRNCRKGQGTNNASAYPPY